MTSGASTPGRVIVVAAPVRPSAGSGNDVTAHRWADLLSALGHQVSVVAVDEGADGIAGATEAALEGADVLLALHARRSASIVAWWHARARTRRLIVALSGTDLYRDMPDDSAAMRSAEVADRLIVLQAAAADRVTRLRPEWAAKTAVVHQSVTPPLPDRQPASGELRVVVLAHLREVKDPLLTARAAARLSSSSRVTVHHAGRAFDDEWAQAARAEEASNPRYHWHRELNRDKALDLLATGHALACTSLSEGGANVVSEAIAMGVPVIGTRIDGNTGLLGEDHPGLVPIGDAAALAELLTAMEHDDDLLADLQRRTDELGPITDPAVEQAALAALLEAD